MITRSYHLMFWKKIFRAELERKTAAAGCVHKGFNNIPKIPIFLLLAEDRLLCFFPCCAHSVSMPTSSHFPSFGGNLIRYELCFLTLYTIIFSIFLPFFPRFAPFASVSLLISHDRIHLNGTASRGGGERRDDTKLILLVFFCRNCGKLFR